MAGHAEVAAAASTAGSLADPATGGGRTGVAGAAGAEGAAGAGPTSGVRAEKAKVDSNSCFNHNYGPVPTM